MGTTIILPCAGEGKRLGLSIPKELYDIIPGIKLIDFSLMHIKKYFEKTSAEDLTIAVVIREEKRVVYEYVKNKFCETNVIPVLFDDNYFEWAGSVYSAKDSFSGKNIVLLPDSVIGVSKYNNFLDQSGFTLIELMEKSLTQKDVSFGYIKCNDSNRLSKLGAIFVDEKKIIKFQDKPRNCFEEYNGFWCTYAFRKECGNALYEFLKRSIKHEDNFYQKESFFPSGGVELYLYHDLGTWETIEEFKNVRMDYSNH